jgi:uncharacterized membrane protein YeaQ/YmgE (transglycosylase-associated protein family)
MWEMMHESAPTQLAAIHQQARAVHNVRRTQKGANTMSLIIFLVVGLIAGVIASYVMGRQQDLLINLLIGVVGALVGGFLAGLLGLGAYNLIGEIIIATLGAIICIYVWQRMR